MVAAAGITLAAAGLAQAATNAGAPATGTSVARAKTESVPTIGRAEVTAGSRSDVRAKQAAAQKAAAARLAADQQAAQQKAAAKLAADTKAAAAKQAAQKKAALAALSSAPAAKPLTVKAPVVSAPAAKPKAKSPLTAGGSSEATTSAGGYVCPIAGCGGRFTSGFGGRTSPGGIGSTNHKGNDFATSIGTPLRAVHSGTVTGVGWYGGLGMRVEIDLGGGTSVVYGHMSAFSTHVGQRVSAGEIIGYSGNTGNSTGPHLHFEVHLGGVPINPGPWMRARGIF
ncbi:M23 family metallopeptidase [Branchiibius sp. NY16-3462-2]|uniref:M23 family metallopeptidase n=1 Tax=Branchiibius sp. NY16-3462-2 TaxID=1807500 RepID=UPI0007932E43|nr:M23 family metallopeptidase [Branchiibius sp. NY16-3462-2]KYH43097.1 hypothetical protein AZH51_06515 [Branchiibius sp. NY16-3462-2]